MYPYAVFLGMGLYEIMIAVGFTCALLNFRVFADRRKFGANLQNLVIICAMAALVSGYFFAVLTQAIYNALDGGKFEIVNNTGATFYGGLIGGAGLFIGVYFLAGHFLLKPREAASHFAELSDIAAGSIAVAHGFGRLGCLFAGCCHGAETDAWYGVYHHYIHAKVVPVQLFEAIFLFALFGALTWRLVKKKKNNLAVYLMAYGVWRFFAEYMRADDRGATVVKFLSPSQLTAILLFLLGVGLMVGAKVVKKNREGDQGEKA